MSANKKLEMLAKVDLMMVPSSFLVESIKHKTIFRVVKVGENIDPEAIVKILENLPISFSIRQTGSENGAVNEPLEVRASAQVIYIYPPRHRIIACTAMEWKRSNPLVGQMNVDNVMDSEYPGGGQIRTCVHFDPKIFGVNNWWQGRDDVVVDGIEIEVDIHVYHPDDENCRPKIKPPGFGKHEVGDLLNLISGGKGLTAEQFLKWRELIMYAVERMKSNYENSDTDPDYPVRVYYKECWYRIEQAGSDSDKIAAALNYLITSIEME